MKQFVSSRKRLLLVSAFMLGFLLVLNLSTLLLYRRAENYLDNELGERLRAIAITLSRATEVASGANLDPDTIDPSFLNALHLVKAENALENILILTPEGRTVVDLGGFTPPGELNPFIDLDFSAVTLARTGYPAYTTLYKSGDLYMKSAYAPIQSPVGDVIGILGVEAGAGFFDVLRALSNLIIGLNLAGITIVVVLGFVFYRQSLSLDRAGAAIIQGENLATMGRMVAGIAHEIRNPLSIIKASAERLEKTAPSSELPAYISEEVDKLDDILTGYLSFARARAQQSSPQPLRKILRRCLMAVDPEIRSRGVEIVQHVPNDEIMVNVDDKRVQQAILNILINAIQAIDANGRIDITLQANSSFALVRIEDNGRGIAGRDLAEVTKPFFTTKERGSGLGMTVVSAVVEEHGGELDIESVPGEGTRVSITLPLARRT